MQTVEEKGSNLDWVSQPLREQKLFSIIDALPFRKLSVLYVEQKNDWAIAEVLELVQTSHHLVTFFSDAWILSV